MSMYILLLTLTPEGREQMLYDSESLLDAAESIDAPDIRVMGLYGVLGSYDFVSLVEAPDNAAIARFSLNLGVTAGVHVMTLPAIPVTRLEPISPPDPVQMEVETSPEPEPAPSSPNGDRDGPG